MFFLSNIPLLVLFFEDIFLRCSISCNNCSWRAFCSSFDGSCSLEVPPKSASVLLFFQALSWRLLASSFVVCFCAFFRKAWTSSFGIWQAGSQVCPSGPYPFHEINSSRLPPTVLLSIILSTRYVLDSTFRLRFCILRASARGYVILALDVGEWIFSLLRHLISKNDGLLAPAIF